MQLRFIGDYPKYEVLRVTSENPLQEVIIGHININAVANVLYYYSWITTFHNLPSDERNQIANFINSHDPQITKFTKPHNTILEFID